MMGTMVVNPESDWMQRIRPVQSIKSGLRCDSWIERKAGLVDPYIRQIAIITAETIPSISENEIFSRLQSGVQDGVLAQAMLPAFAELFRNLSEVEIDRMMQSFAFMNCRPRQELAGLLQEKLNRPG